MEKVNVIASIKFGSYDNIMDMLDNGTIYCNTLDYFKKIEDGFVRGDAHEGTVRITNFPKDSKITIHLADRDIELKTARLQLREAYQDVPANVYCFTVITVEEIVKAGSLKLDKKNCEFGTHFILIKDNKQFFERLHQAFRKAGLIFETGFITYYDKEAEEGELGLFHKSHEFAYQKEFRILIQNHERKTIKIHLGSLRDIAEVYESKHLESLVCIDQGQQNTA